MSRADDIYRETCLDILENGWSDEGLEVRPRWEDGTPAHTIKKFCVVNRYDLRKEFPLMTLRKTGVRNCIDEILWIWQKKSNRIADLHSHIWDAWAGPDGTIGKAYGYQLGVKHKYAEGEFDQVDRVLYDLKHNRASRRIMTNIYNHADLHEMNLYPCAYSMTFNVTGNYLKGADIGVSTFVFGTHHGLSKAGGAVAPVARLAAVADSEEVLVCVGQVGDIIDIK